MNELFSISDLRELPSFREKVKYRAVNILLLERKVSERVGITTRFDAAIFDG